MKLAVLTWIHDRKAKRWKHWPVVGVVRAYAIGYVEGRRYGKGCWLDEFFGAYHPATSRRASSLDRERAVPRAYRRGRRVGAEERRERSSLRLVA